MCFSISWPFERCHLCKQCLSCLKLCYFNQYLTFNVEFNIRAVLTTAKGYDRNIPKTKLEMYDYYPLDDKESCQISPYFERAANFIANALTKTNVRSIIFRCSFTVLLEWVDQWVWCLHIWSEIGICRTNKPTWQ